MKVALLTEVKTVQLNDVDYRKPDPGYIVINTKSTGICGTDLHNYHQAGGFSAQQAGGHELAGIVDEVGEGVTRFRPGDRVVIEAICGCGSCIYCKRGLYNVCQDRDSARGNGHGGFAEYATAHESTVYKIPPEMSYEQGALVEPLAVAFRVLMESGATMQDRVAIIGGGSIGLLCLTVAKAMGVKETLIIAKYPQQVNVARIYGADHIIDITDADVQAACADITDGLGVDVVIETTSSASAFSDALAIVRNRGTVVLVGIYTKPLSVDLNNIVVNEINVKGSMCYSHSGFVNDFEAAIESIASGAVDPTQIVTHRFTLDEAVEAFKIANDKSSGSIKVNIHQ